MYSDSISFDRHSIPQTDTVTYMHCIHHHIALEYHWSLWLHVCRHLFWRSLILWIGPKTGFFMNYSISSTAQPPACSFLPLYALVYCHTYTHAFIHTYIHTCIHTYIHTYIHTHIRTYLHTYIHEHIHTYIHTCMQTYIHTYFLAIKESLVSHIADVNAFVVA